MARYQNDLDKFNSHSIHYVVLACRSTEDIRNFSSSSSLQAIDRTKQLGDEVRLDSTKGRGSVYLMLDTRRFSQFMIEDFSLETLIAGFSVP